MMLADVEVARQKLAKVEPEEEDGDECDEEEGGEEEPASCICLVHDLFFAHTHTSVTE